MHRAKTLRRPFTSVLGGSAALLLSLSLVGCGTETSSSQAERHVQTPSATSAQDTESEQPADEKTPKDTSGADTDADTTPRKTHSSAKDKKKAQKGSSAKTEKSSEKKSHSSGGDTAAQELDSLKVKGRAPKTGYDRESFRWRDDVDHNGCDTRNDVLRRDLSDIVLKPGTKGCVVLIGTLEDSPYSGDDVHFHQQDDNNLDIDHVVALSAAWQTGAGSWSDDQRREFANDPRNLLAVESSLNRQKGDGDAATWLPPSKSARCNYVARQIGVKHDYDLWVTRSEKDAMARVLSGCSDPAAFDDSAKAVGWPGPGAGDGAREATAEEMRGTGKASSADGRTTPGRTSGTGKGSSHGTKGSGTYYENCDAVRAAGKAPIRRGEPGYGKHLDRDEDGVGCE